MVRPMPHIKRAKLPHLDLLTRTQLQEQRKKGSILQLPSLCINTMCTESYVHVILQGSSELGCIIFASPIGMKVNMQIISTKKETKGLGQRNKATPKDAVSPRRKPTEDADLPGPRCATMAPETALIQLCISSGLSA